MAKRTIPFTGTEVDTDDPAEAAKDYGYIVAGFIALFSAVGIASYAFNRIKELGGIEGEAEVPGI